MRYALPAAALAAYSSAAAALSSTCPLPWNRDPNDPNKIDPNAKCPNATKFPVPKFDITIPDDAGIVEWICVVYGALPYIIPIASFMGTMTHFCRYHCLRSRDLSFFGFVLVSVLVNELIFKNLAMDPRPDKSCNTTCGFPSGHSTMALGFFTLMLCDAVFRVRPKMPPTFQAALEENRHVSDFGEVNRFELLRSETKLMLSIVPLSADDTLGPSDFLMFVGFWSIMLVPVPFSRVVLYDHTPLQVMVGSFIGMIEATCWFIYVRGIQKRYNGRLGDRLCRGWVVHNHALPRFEVQANCFRVLARMKRESQTCTGTQSFDSTVSLSHSNICVLESMKDEIAWYLNQEKHSRMPVLEDKIHSLLEDTSLRALRDKIDEVMKSGLDAALKEPWEHSTSECTSARQSPRPPAHWRFDVRRGAAAGSTQMFER